MSEVRVSKFEKLIRNHFEKVSSSNSLQRLNKILGNDLRDSTYKKIARTCKKLSEGDEPFLFKTENVTDKGTEIWYSIMQAPEAIPEEPIEISNKLEPVNPEGYEILPGLKWRPEDGDAPGIWRNRIGAHCLWTVIWWVKANPLLTGQHVPGLTRIARHKDDNPEQRGYRLDHIQSRLRCSENGKLSSVQLYYELKDLVARGNNKATKVFWESASYANGDTTIDFERIRKFLEEERRQYSRHEYVGNWSVPIGLMDYPQRAGWPITQSDRPMVQQPIKRRGMVEDGGSIESAMPGRHRSRTAQEVIDRGEGYRIKLRSDDD